MMLCRVPSSSRIQRLGIGGGVVATVGGVEPRDAAICSPIPRSKEKDAAPVRFQGALLERRGLAPLAPLKLEGECPLEIGKTT